MGACRAQGRGLKGLTEGLLTLTGLTKADGKGHRWRSQVFGREVRQLLCVWKDTLILGFKHSVLMGSGSRGRCWAGTQQGWKATALWEPEEEFSSCLDTGDRGLCSCPGQGSALLGWSQSTSPSSRRKSQHPSQSGMQMLPPRGFPCSCWCLLCSFSASEGPLPPALTLGRFGRAHLSEGTSQLSDYRALG